MILHIFQYQIDKNTPLDTQNASKTQKNIDVPHIVCYNLFDKGAYIMKHQRSQKSRQNLEHRVVLHPLFSQWYFLRSASTLS